MNPDSLRTLVLRLPTTDRDDKLLLDHADQWEADIEELEVQIGAYQNAMLAELDANAALREQYNQLIHAVETKHEGESRHETALRYIREAEYKAVAAAVAALASQEVKP
jgi:hypothetical protein